MLHFEYSSTIHASQEVVFGFHERRDALELLTPSFPPCKVLRKDLGLAAGNVVILRMGWGPIGVTWVAHHIAYRPPELFVDEMRSGPLAAWVHAHQFFADGANTRLVDSVEFALPGPPWVERYFGWFVQWQLRMMFAERHRTTKKYCEAAGAA